MAGLLPAGALARQAADHHVGPGLGPQTTGGQTGRHAMARGRAVRMRGRAGGRQSQRVALPSWGGAVGPHCTRGGAACTSVRPLLASSGHTLQSIDCRVPGTVGGHARRRRSGRPAGALAHLLPPPTAAPSPTRSDAGAVSNVASTPAKRKVLIIRVWTRVHRNRAGGSGRQGCQSKPPRAQNALCCAM